VDIRDAVKALKEEHVLIADEIARTETHLGDLQKKLSGIASAISALEPLCEEPSGLAARLLDSLDNAPGITDSVRAIFKSNRLQYLTPTQLRDALKTHELIKGYDNEMAVIHQVISRLKEKGQIRQHATQKAYRWSLREGPLSRRYGSENSLANQIANKMLEAKEEK
jgi:hypothetical protein